MTTNYPVLSREEYRWLLGEGFKFRDAYLYEPDQAPKTAVFVTVDLGPGAGTIFKRRLN